jgi:hypothetical protein
MTDAVILIEAFFERAAVEPEGQLFSRRHLKDEAGPVRRVDQFDQCISVEFFRDLSHYLTVAENQVILDRVIHHIRDVHGGGIGAFGDELQDLQFEEVVDEEEQVFV